MRRALKQQLNRQVMQKKKLRKQEMKIKGLKG